MFKFQSLDKDVHINVHISSLDKDVHINVQISSLDKDVHINVQQDPSSPSSSSSEDSSGDENKGDHTDLVCHENRKEISESKPAENKDLEENLHPMNQYIM